MAPRPANIYTLIDHNEALKIMRSLKIVMKPSKLSETSISVPQRSAIWRRKVRASHSTPQSPVRGPTLTEP